MYIPSEKILKNYADVMVKFALNGWKWIKKWEVVMLQVREPAKPLLKQLQISVLEAWWYPIIRFIPNGMDRDFYNFANDDQLVWSPKNVNLEQINTIDHLLQVIAEDDKSELEWIDSKKIMNKWKSMKYLMDARHEKEWEWKFTWTLGLYGTQSMADMAWLSLEEYRDQIIKACFLDKENPVQERQNVFDQLESTKSKLDALDIDYIHIYWPKIDLKVKIWANRKWLWWSGRNIPSFELFISPDWRWTNWYVQFDQPLFRYGQLIKDVYLEFVDWVVTKATASQNEQTLLDMIAVENANKIWEFSLTDRRVSRITKFMWETLYDENVWWEFGNTHIALGNAYKDSFTGDIKNTTKEQRIDMWYNESAVHTDIVSTSDRTAVAYLSDWSSKIIYQWWEFVL